MGLDEYAGNPDRHRGARQHRHEFAFAARRAALAARLLHRMGGVKDHRRAGVLRHDRQRAHIRYQRVVAERHAALGDQHVGIAGAGQLVDDIGHVPGRQKLALLDVDHLAGRRRGQQQIGLPAQKRRDLQHVDRLRGDRALLRLMHVGQHRQLQRVADFGKHRQRVSQADAARGAGAGAVGLVERSLEHQANAEPRRDLLERARHLQRMRPAFELARPGDDRQRQRIAKRHRTCGDDGGGLRTGQYRLPCS